MTKKMFAEFVGTFTLILLGAGSIMTGKADLVGDGHKNERGCRACPHDAHRPLVHPGHDQTQAQQPAQEVNHHQQGELAGKDEPLFDHDSVPREAQPGPIAAQNETTASTPTCDSE